jgi:hypothetical protein
MRVKALTSVLLPAIACCGCAYKADTFSYASRPFRGVYVSVSCLDLGIERRTTSESKNVVGYQFGNRCDTPVVVDLASASVYGDDGGSPIRLFAFDPFHEIRAMELDARAVGRESLEYPSEVDVGRLCVDAASIAHTSPARWVCFNNED